MAEQTEAELNPKPAAPENAPRQVSGLKNDEFIRLLGEVCWLMSRSPQRRYSFMGDLEWLVMPPLARGQARLYRNDKADPIAFVSWALVSDAVNERLQAGVAKLSPSDWHSGPHLWVIDVVAPFGGVEEALKSVQTTVFGGRALPVLVLGGRILEATTGAKTASQTAP